MNESKLPNCVALVYEIENNPLFSATADSYDDRLTEFACPSETNDILRVLKSVGIQTEVIDGPVQLLADAERLKNKKCYILNKSIGFKGLERKIHVPAICQLYDLPLVGSSAYAMTLARHKFHTNRLLAGLGLPVPQACLISHLSDDIRQPIRFPVIVKPNQESDSVGIDENSIVYESSLAVARANWLLSEFGQPAIVEEYIPGEEWKLSMLGYGETTRCVGGVGVLKNNTPIVNSLQTRTDVLEDNLDYYRIADSASFRKAKEWAIQIHQILGLRDYSRIDFRLDPSGHPICMEVSTHPHIGRSSSYLAAGMLEFGSEDHALLAILKSADRRIATDS